MIVGVKSYMDSSIQQVEIESCTAASTMEAEKTLNLEAQISGDDSQETPTLKFALLVPGYSVAWVMAARVEFPPTKTPFRGGTDALLVLGPTISHSLFGSSTKG